MRWVRFLLYELCLFCVTLAPVPEMLLWEITPPAPCHRPNLSKNFFETSFKARGVQHETCNPGRSFSNTHTTPLRLIPSFILISEWCLSQGRLNVNGGNRLGRWHPSLWHRTGFKVIFTRSRKQITSHCRNRLIFSYLKWELKRLSGWFSKKC